MANAAVGRGGNGNLAPVVNDGKRQSQSEDAAQASSYRPKSRIYPTAS